jgi:hypothetical protein
MIAQYLKPFAIDFDPCIAAINRCRDKALIEVILNCNPLLEIWPTGLQTRD